MANRNTNKSKKEEEEVMQGFTLDTSTEESEFVPAQAPVDIPEEKKPAVESPRSSTLINCLRNEKIIVRHIAKKTGLVDNPKHVLYGGMSENSIRVFCVPFLSNGTYVNVLTKAEKDFLENELGLEHNALSVHRQANNFWDDQRVILKKQDNFLDLSKPADYISYKILLANKETIAPSLSALQDCPKATYQFVIISEGEEVKAAKSNMSNIQQCYMEFGKVQEDFNVLRIVIETITGRPINSNTKLDFLQTQVNEIIQSQPKTFLDVVRDELLPMKVLLKQSVENGAVATRGNQYYLREGNVPMCSYGEEPTFSNAAKYLSNPKNQEVLFALQMKAKSK